MRPYQVAEEDGTDNFEEVRVADDTFSDINVVKDPVDAEILGDNVAHDQHKANIERQGSCQARELCRDIQTHHRRDVKQNEPAQLQTTEQRATILSLQGTIGCEHRRKACLKINSPQL